MAATIPVLGLGLTWYVEMLELKLDAKDRSMQKVVDKEWCAKRLCGGRAGVANFCNKLWTLWWLTIACRC